MADEGRAGRHGRVAENVVRMFMRVDHIADRLVGDAADGQKQTLPDGDAAAGVDKRHGILSNDDAEIGDVASIVRCRQRDLSEMCIVAIGHFLRLRAALFVGFAAFAAP